MLIINTQKETKKQPAPVYRLPLLLPCPYSFLLRFSVHHVSYPHLTLPPVYFVEISVVAVTDNNQQNAHPLAYGRLIY